MRAKIGGVGALECHCAARRPHETADTPQDRSLSCAIVTDDGYQLATLDFHVCPANGGSGSIFDLKIADFKQCFGSHAVAPSCFRVPK